MQVLYLHGCRGAPNKGRCKLLVELYGKDEVVSPNLGTAGRFYLWNIGWWFSAILSVLCCLVYVSILSALPALCSSLATCIVTVLSLYFTKKWIIISRLKAGGEIVRKAIDRNRPDLIVASGTGAAILSALYHPEWFHPKTNAKRDKNPLSSSETSSSTNIPVVNEEPSLSRLPCLLLSPANVAIARCVHRVDPLPLRNFGQCVIVHGTRDSATSVAEAVLLSETAMPACLESGVGGSPAALELIYDDHRLRNLPINDLKNLADNLIFPGGPKSRLSKAFMSSRGVANSGKISFSYTEEVSDEAA